MGGEFSPPLTQVDRYFAHPSRDFAATDEALRIRTHGENAWVTYKGPKIDTTTKTRREIDFPLPAGDELSSLFQELLEALGFHEVATVRKSRRTAAIDWQGRAFHIDLDEVEQLGSFVELETVVAESDLDMARHQLDALRDELALSGDERRSYLELLLGQGATRT